MAIEYLNQHQGFDRTGIGGTGKQAFKTFFKGQIRPNWLKKELPNYRVIALPTYEGSQMVCKATRKIRSKTARNMLTFAMYRFSQVLECQCAKHSSILTRHTEEYTSKRDLNWSYGMEHRVLMGFPPHTLMERTL